MFVSEIYFVQISSLFVFSFVLVTFVFDNLKFRGRHKGLFKNAPTFPYSYIKLNCRR